MRFDYPSTFQRWSLHAHAVVDNNRTRQAVADLTRAWTMKQPAKRHQLTCFAFAESSAMNYRNWKHRGQPAGVLTKIEWRKAVAEGLLQAAQAGQAGGADAAGGEEEFNGYPTEACLEGLQKFPEFSRWDENTRRFETVLARRVVRLPPHAPRAFSAASLLLNFHFVVGCACSIMNLLSIVRGVGAGTAALHGEK